MATEAEQAIVAHLTRRPRADPDTIEFQKVRLLATCEMHQVAFTNHREYRMEYIIRTWRTPGGTWVVAPIGGGSRGPSRRQEPWVNFTAGWGDDGFTAGGRVEGIGSEQSHLVRLTFADGLILTDTVDDGIVLFFEPRAVSFPADVQIEDVQASLIASYKEFDQFPFFS